MAMERFLTALVFCEAPLDAAFYGTSATAGVKTVSATNPGGAMKPAAPAAPEAKADTEKQCFSGKSSAQRHVGFELAFDGLNCFETVVMH